MFYLYRFLCAAYPSRDFWISMKWSVLHKPIVNVDWKWSAANRLSFSSDKDLIHQDLLFMKNIVCSYMYQSIIFINYTFNRNPLILNMRLDFFCEKIVIWNPKASIKINLILQRLKHVDVQFRPIFQYLLCWKLPLTSIDSIIIWLCWKKYHD